MKTEATIRAMIRSWETRCTELEEMHARGASWASLERTVGEESRGSHDLQDRLAVMIRSLRWVLEEDMAGIDPDPSAHKTPDPRPGGPEPIGECYVAVVLTPDLEMTVYRDRAWNDVIHHVWSQCSPLDHAGRGVRLERFEQPGAPRGAKFWMINTGLERVCARIITVGQEVP